MEDEPAEFLVTTSRGDVVGVYSVKKDALLARDKLLKANPNKQYFVTARSQWLGSA